MRDSILPLVRRLGASVIFRIMAFTRSMDHTQDILIGLLCGFSSGCQQATITDQGSVLVPAIFVCSVYLD